MFNSTHTLVGIALARAGLDRWSRHAAWTAVIASNIPDIDIVAGLYGTSTYLEYHRGITHSIVGIPVLSILVAAAMYKFSGNFWKTFVIALAAMSTHLGLDYLNTYGVRPFLPFDGTWFYGDALFIIDPFFDVTLIAVLAAGYFLSTRRRQLAVIGLIVVTLYVGFRLELRNLSRAYLAGFQKAAVSPLALNPFQWTGFIDNPRDVSVVGINAFRGVVSQPFSLAKDPANAIIVRASTSYSARAFLGFARFPVTTVRYRDSRYFVTFFDVRYYNGGSALGAKVLLDPSLQIVGESVSFVQPLD